MIQIRRALRMLLLPMRVTQEAVAARVLGITLRHMGVSGNDYVRWVEVEKSRWSQSGGPTEAFRLLVEEILKASDPVHGELIAEGYFPSHQKLCRDHLLNHDEAVAFLSHICMILDLAGKERLTAAQIARVLKAYDQRVSFSRQTISVVLRSLKLDAALDFSEMQRLFQRDRETELSTFADANIFDSAQLVAAAAESLGFPGDISRPLLVLASEEAPARYGPYCQMLHYQCVIAEYFDHAVTDLYEFRPRGVNADWLFKKYPPSLSSAGNPFLNNAKSVERIDESWARSKEAQLPGAMALLAVLAGMEGMGFASRRELARWVRLWIHRLVRASVPHAIQLADAWSDVEVARVLAAVCSGNTKTFGVLEQRVVDAIAADRFREGEGWRGRGLGDSVNATNTSRRKLGDCEFQNAATRQLVAFESHGGTLSETYVDGHLRTLEKCIGPRIEELSGISSIDEWAMTIAFIAHNVQVAMPCEVSIGGVRIELVAKTFEEFLHEADAPSRESVNCYVLASLREARTPEEVRRRVLEILA